MVRWNRYILLSTWLGFIFSVKPKTEPSTVDKKAADSASAALSDDNGDGDDESDIYSEDAKPLRDLTDSDLRRIVSEQAIDDPLNGFYDPFEAYRLSTYAYFNPITFPLEHDNPPIPVGFLPPNAPPKSLPSDFFFFNDDSHRIVLGEHAASFCPYIRRWREKHPLRPYPVEENFLDRHPPIKFDPSVGYTIDIEQCPLNSIFRKAEEELFEKYAYEMEQEILESGIVDFEDTDSQVPAKSDKASDLKALRSPFFKWKKFMEIVRGLMKKRSDCSTLKKFTEPVVYFGMYGSSPLTCMQEAIILLDKWEDDNLEITIEEEIPEFVDKAEKYRQILLLKSRKAKKEGKCPFNYFNSSHDSKDKDHHNSKTKTKKGDTSYLPSRPTRLFKNSLPKWLELGPGERLFSSEEEPEPDTYRFLYKQVSFPSIQKTLRKFACI